MVLRIFRESERFERRGITDLHILEKSVKVVKSDNLTQETGRPLQCPLVRLASLI
jgi:hypothetical protein